MKGLDPLKRVFMLCTMILAISATGSFAEDPAEKMARQLQDLHTQRMDAQRLLAGAEVVEVGVVDHLAADHDPRRRGVDHSLGDVMAARCLGSGACSIEARRATDTHQGRTLAIITNEHRRDPCQALRPADGYYLVFHRAIIGIVRDLARPLGALTGS